MPKLSRMVLGALVATVVVPVLAASPAAAATTAAGATTTATSTSAGSPTASTELSVPAGLCRLFPKMCAKVSPSAVGSDA